MEWDFSLFPTQTHNEQNTLQKHQTADLRAPDASHIMNKTAYKSTERRIREICELTRQHYEQGNQSKCYRAVWRRYIEPRYGICYRTYLNYINRTIGKTRR